MKDQMTNVERVRAILSFQPFDRLPVVEWAPWWDQTIARWRGEGLPAGDRYEICRHFGLDMFRHDWFRQRGPGCPEAEHFGAGIVANFHFIAVVFDFIATVLAVRDRLRELVSPIVKQIERCNVGRCKILSRARPPF